MDSFEPQLTQYFQALYEYSLERQLAFAVKYWCIENSRQMCGSADHNLEVASILLWKKKDTELEENMFLF